jgi:ABC-type uncharacterized transport system YnjBCD permease subunit
MGRNFLSATELVHQVIADLKPFADMLPPQDRIIFNRFAEYALNNRAAIANATSLLPLEATLLILLLEEHKRSQRLYNELLTEIERLKKATASVAELIRPDRDGP